MDPIVSFSGMATHLVMKTNPTIRVRWGTLRLPRPAPVPQPRSTDIGPEHAMATWRTVARGYREGTIRTQLRQLSVLHRSIAMAAARSDADMPTLRRLAREAWQDVRREVAARLRVIDARTELADPSASPDCDHWQRHARANPDGDWSGDRVRLLAAELETRVARLGWARANLKLLALHLDEIQWLARFARRPFGLWLSGTPSRSQLARRLARIGRLKARCTATLRELLDGPLGPRLQRELQDL